MHDLVLLGPLPVLPKYTSLALRQSNLEQSLPYLVTVSVCPPVCCTLHTHTQVGFAVVDEKRSNRNGFLGGVILDARFRFSCCSKVKSKMYKC